MGAGFGGLLKEPRRMPMRMVDRRLVQNFDWRLLLLVLAIAVIGFFNLYSAVSAGRETAAGPAPLRHLYWMGIGLFVMTLSFIPDYRLSERFAYLIYWGAIGLLVAVLLMGTTVKG
ncbi:MAG: FtsW/RodA/SpoVE family cell cycle protein, partial [Thermoplasmata archaeon]